MLLSASSYRSVCGCIVDENLFALALTTVKEREGEIEGLTNTQLSRRLGPKCANKNRKLSKLHKENDVRYFGIKRPLLEKEGNLFNKKFWSIDQF